MAASKKVFTTLLKAPLPMRGMYGKKASLVIL